MSVTSETIVTAPGGTEVGLTRPLILLFAVSVGIIVTNVFAPQTLVGLIGPAFGLTTAGSGLVATATLLGYAAGLFLLVPLADLVENRWLIVRMLGCAAACAGLVTLAPTAAALLAILFLLGAACSAIQILVPIAASMAPPERRGRVIGDVMSGLMVGILLSRPLASAVADGFGWRAFYAGSGLVMGLLTLVLALRLPRRRPAGRIGYAALIASLWHLLRTETVLRTRALTASLVMAAFSAFWTAVALRLAQPPFELSQRGIALFALVGAGGAAVTPLFGRAGDRGWTRPATVASHIAIVVAFAGAAWGGAGAGAAGVGSLILLVASAVLLDVGATGDQMLGRYAINQLRPEARGRLNGLFVGLFFLGGAAGSALAGIAWSIGGWPLICLIGAGFGLAALVVDILGRAR
ncbi:putative MFS family arabinose efflux permease [Inquilinus ginsengisoli]|uniref:MFS family arabinose efflux permease n=1 Tax=Inquilinus ginsengisoli TaxID=363840 RepID=A0ABU1JNG4_9PROT|nr:MFS transporter [Inquilinus ginsengisoli]MDR6290162.1 putative MFS family arabinose efflux permease [Inquilinus ginsengisoli]